MHTSNVRKVEVIRLVSLDLTAHLVLQGKIQAVGANNVSINVDVDVKPAVTRLEERVCGCRCECGCRCGEGGEGGEVRRGERQ